MNHMLDCCLLLDICRLGLFKSVNFLSMLFYVVLNFTFFCQQTPAFYVNAFLVFQFSSQIWKVVGDFRGLSSGAFNESEFLFIPLVLSVKHFARHLFTSQLLYMCITALAEMGGVQSIDNVCLHFLKNYCLQFSERNRKADVASR